MANLLFQILLFALPLLVIPFGPSQFEIPKVILGMVLIDSLGLYVLITKKRNSFRLSLPLVLLLGPLVLLTIYDLIFLRTSISLWGNQYRMQGVVLLWQLIFLAFVSAQIPYKRMAYYWYGLVLLIIFVTSFIFGNAANRAVGTLGEPNALAAFAVFLWPFVFFAPDIAKRYKKYIQAGSVFLVLLIILLSGSRSGLLAFGIQLIFYLLNKTTHKLKFALSISLVLLLVVQILPFIQHTKYEDRATIWQTAVTAGMHHSVIGGGFGNIELSLRQAIVKQHNTLIGYYIDSSHNLLLDWWVQGGIVGVGILLSLLLLTVKNFYQRNQQFYLVLLFGLLTAALFNPVSVVLLIEFWWLIGQGVNNLE